MDEFTRQKPVELERLIESARVQSTEASNKIEGIVTTSTRIKQLMNEKTTPKSRDESEIVGYRDVEDLIIKCGSGRGTFYVRKDAMENENLPQYR